MAQIVEILPLLVVGILVGSEFAVAAFLNPIAGRLPDDAFRAARSDGARLLGRVMPFWYIGALALLVATAVVTRSWLVGAAVALLVAVVLLTVTAMVPINNRIAAWSATGELSRPLAARWDRLHRLRVAMLAVVFVLLVIGVLNA